MIGSFVFYISSGEGKEMDWNLTRGARSGERGSDIAHFVNATADESNQANKQAAAVEATLRHKRHTKQSRVSQTVKTATDHAYYCGILAHASRFRI